MKTRHYGFVSTPVILLLLFGVSVDSFGQEVDETCLVEALAAADDSTTIGDLHVLCGVERAGDEVQVPAYEGSAFEERVAMEREAETRPFILTTHQPNYLMFSRMDTPNQAPFAGLTAVANPIDENEMLFQVSYKAQIWRHMFGSNIDTYFAYTARSWWQLFTDNISAPFRETNYQPEFFLRSFNKHKFLGMSVGGWDFGLNHESNGRSLQLTRSWNRVMGRVGLQLHDDLTLLVRAWYRLPEDVADDDNPHMHRYYGYGDLRAIWTPKRNTFTAMLRPGTQETSYEVTWSYPISSVFRVYAQYYKGFGESMLDYDYDNERFGIGIAMNDFLGRY